MRKPNACSNSRLFPPQGTWEKDHGRLSRWRLARVATSPEEIGLCGCWQVIAVERFRQELHEPEQPPAGEIGYYAASLATDQHEDAGILAIVRGHWAAIENGTHHRRDVTFREDDCRTANRKGAAVLASLRNLANGIFELQKDRGRTTAATLKSWCQQQTFTTVWPVLNR